MRNPPADLPIASGKKRSGKRVLMVGTDCAIGKKYSALALNQAMQKAGLNSTFRATGQTGIMLAGEGLPIDAVVADFIAGAAEMVSPDNPLTVEIVSISLVDKSKVKTAFSDAAYTRSFP